MLLYLYGTAEDVRSWLRSGLLPMQSLVTSHNPFLLNKPMANSNRQGVGADQYEQELQKQYQALPDNLRAMVTFDYFRQQSEKKRDQIEQAIVTKQTGPTDALLYDQEKYSQMVYLSLYSSATHAGHWQYHANAHQGVCLELDAEHVFFKGKSGQPTLLKAIQYGKNKIIQGTKDNPFPGLFSLPEELSLEKEWRLLKFARHCEQDKHQQPRIKFPPKLIRSCFLGARMSDTDQQDWKDWLALDMHYRSMSLNRIVLDPYQLVLRRETL